MEQYIKGASNRADEEDSYSDDAKDQSHLQTQYGNYDEGDYQDGSADSADHESSSGEDDDEPDPFESFITGTNNPFATFTFNQPGMWEVISSLTCSNPRFIPTKYGSYRWPCLCYEQPFSNHYREPFRHRNCSACRQSVCHLHPDNNYCYNDICQSFHDGYSWSCTVSWRLCAPNFLELSLALQVSLASTPLLLLVPIPLLQ